MSRKTKQFDYFGALGKIAENSHEAANLLSKYLKIYDAEVFPEQVKVIHDLEKESDSITREMLQELNNAFITPIDREDLVILADQLDDVMDEINAACYLFDNMAIKTLRPEVLEISKYVVDACQGVYLVAKEFPKYKNSKELGKLIDQVKVIERKSDRLYSSVIKDLMHNEDNPIEIIKWKEVFDTFEHAINNTEKAVNALAGAAIKNS